MNKFPVSKKTTKDFRLSSSTSPKTTSKKKPNPINLKKEAELLQEWESGLSYFEEMIKELDKKLSAAQKKNAALSSEKGADFRKNLPTILPKTKTRPSLPKEPSSSSSTNGKSSKKIEEENDDSPDLSSSNNSLLSTSSMSKTQSEKMPVIILKKNQKSKKTQKQSLSAGISK